jgi:transcriptional regulator of arginine metabolism
METGKKERTARRRELIIKFLEMKVRTQDQLIQLLRKEGEEVTQPTLSRDFKTLGIVIGPDGTYMYSNDESEKRERLLLLLLQEKVLSIPRKYASFLIHTKDDSSTLLGKLLKQQYPEDVIECLGFGDALMVFARDEKARLKLIKRLENQELDGENAEER